MTTFEENLNPEQLKAARQVDGRVLVLAGAGSGKTRVLTTRMSYLVRTLGVPPEAILGLTFTNKAAEEMRERLSRLLSPAESKKISLCTFHSFCMQVLREEIHHLGFTSHFSLYDEKDLERIIKLIARDLLEHEGELPSLGATLSAISKASQCGVPPINGETSSWHDRFTGEVYDRLKAALRAYNAVDFDHLLTLTVELFTTHLDVLNRYQDRFRYIMIDEYQDTNPVQFRLAELLTAGHKNLFVVGDDDQAIYGWRGADVANILKFSDAEVIKLEQNYRSCNTILQAANAVIAHNQTRHPKALWGKKGAGDLIHVFVAPTEKEEAEAVIARLARLKERGMPWSDMAILYRSNALSRPFEVALLKQRWKSGEKWVTGIPFEVFGGTEFYERREIKDLLAYLRAAINPLDQEALLRIVNLPRRGIGEVALDKITEKSRKEKIPLWDVFEKASQGVGEWKSAIPERTRGAITEFLYVLKEASSRFRGGELAETLRWLIERIQFQKSIKEDVKSDKMRGFKWENVEEFVSILADYEGELGDKASLADFVSSMALRLNSNLFASSQERGDQVKLMTFHGAKGLEFEACFLVGLEDHLIPHEKSLKETGLEEERRLMYVAITRAKTLLTLSMTKQRKRMGKEAPSKPSRFLFEIPKELLKPVEWHQV